MFIVNLLNHSKVNNIPDVSSDTDVVWGFHSQHKGKHWPSVFIVFFESPQNSFLSSKNLRHQKKWAEFPLQIAVFMKWTVHRRSTVTDSFLSRSEISISKRNVCAPPAPMEVSSRKECWRVCGSFHTHCILWLSYYSRVGIVWFRCSVVIHNVQTLDQRSV